MNETSELRESHLRSLLKAISYRIVGSITTWLLAWAVTGSLSVATTMGLLEPAAKMVLYYLHERAWQLLPRGTVRRLAHWRSGAN